MNIIFIQISLRISKNIFSLGLKENRLIKRLYSAAFYAVINFLSFVHSLVPIYALIKLSGEIFGCKTPVKFSCRRRTVRILEKETSGVYDRDITIEKPSGALDGDFHQRTQQLCRLLHNPQRHAIARILELVNEA